MSLEIIESAGRTIAEIVSDDVVITSVQDALDLMGTAMYQDASALVLSEKHLTPAFFDLKTGLAGDVLQKFSNYGMKLVIIGDFSAVESKSLRAFIAESNRGNQIAFATDRQTALEKLKTQ